jgi:hypothetical protein
VLVVGLLRDVPVPVRTTGASWLLGSVATAAANGEQAISAQEIFGFCGNNNVIQLSGSTGRENSPTIRLCKLQTMTVGCFSLRGVVWWGDPQEGEEELALLWPWGRTICIFTVMKIRFSHGPFLHARGQHHSRFQDSLFPGLM